MFAHYPTETIAAIAAVARTDVAGRLGATRNGYIIYPELKNIFSGEDVMAALALAADREGAGRITLGVGR